MVEMKRPDQEVADRIIEKLREQGILSDTTLEKLRPKLVAGDLSADDWKLTIELDGADSKKVTNHED